MAQVTLLIDVTVDGDDIVEWRIFRSNDDRWTEN